MNRRFILHVLLILALVCTTAHAKDSPRPAPARGHVEVIRGGPADPAKALSDTVLVMGPWSSGAPANGQFETAGGLPAWNGWTHADQSARTASAWHVSDYNAAYLNGHSPGNLAAYCGDEGIPACAPDDTAGGYFDNWFEVLQWEESVADPSAGCRLEVDAWLNYDLEPGYDELSLRLVLGDGSVIELASYTNTGANVNLHATCDLEPGDYIDGDLIRLRLIVDTDNGWSDIGCLWPTKGACQIDDLTVTLDNGDLVSVSDFEDGTLGDWTPWLRTGVGDFTHLANGLGDIDPCLDNASWQACFVDDGVVVPGTGGTACLTWCYGPGGYVLNYDGGLAPGGLLHNTIESPVMAWPGGGCNGGRLEFDAYLHFDPLDAAMVPMLGEVLWRFTTSEDPDDIRYESWNNGHVGYYGQGYLRLGFDLGPDLPDGATFYQASLGVFQMADWDWTWPDGTPAPYYDNVRVTAYRYGGPYLYTWPNTLAQDAFPESGILDQVNPGANSVRFDTPGYIRSGYEDYVDHGDSVVFHIEAAGEGNVLQGAPRMYYRLAANPVFDPHRTAGLPSEGYVEGEPVAGGAVITDGYFAFDLPDSGFLYPGDALHYYVEATQWDPSLGVTTGILPADTTGFSDFSTAAYDPLFTFRALPDLVADGDTLRHRARILYWEDTGSGGDQVRKWVDALEFCNVSLEADYDIFQSNTDAAEESGLGHSATLEQLAGYEIILHNSGACLRQPLGSGIADFGEFSPDLPLLDAWLEQGGRGLLLSGDDIIHDMGFREDWTRLLYHIDPLGDLIGNQESPRVAGTDTPWLGDLDWIAYGGCPDLRAFAAVEAMSGAERLAEFLTPDGAAGGYPYAAITGCTEPVSGSRVVSTTFALERVEDASRITAPFPPPVRHRLLGRLLEYLQVLRRPVASPPDPGILTAVGYPNPFNPSIRIDFHLPQAERTRVRIYTLRGECVRTLLDEPREPGANRVAWNGLDDSGRQAASGVYFYEVTAGGQVVLGKMTLVK